MRQWQNGRCRELFNGAENEKEWFGKRYYNLPITVHPVLGSCFDGKESPCEDFGCAGAGAWCRRNKCWERHCPSPWDIRIHQLPCLGSNSLWESSIPRPWLGGVWPTRGGNSQFRINKWNSEECLLMYPFKFQSLLQWTERRCTVGGRDFIMITQAIGELHEIGLRTNKSRSRPWQDPWWYGKRGGDPI